MRRNTKEKWVSCACIHYSNDIINNTGDIIPSHKQFLEWTEKEEEMTSTSYAKGVQSYTKHDDI